MFECSSGITFDSLRSLGFVSNDPLPVTTLTQSPVEVLLVEDNPTSRTVVRRILERSGCRVDTAEEGQSALSLIERNRYDVVVLDQQLPLLDGYEIIKRVRAGELGDVAAQLTLLMLSGDVPDDERQTWLNEQRVTYLTKPVTVIALASFINDYRQNSSKG